ncbi:MULTISPECIES: biotin/lipoyl-binding carrier protein [Mumia]|uniref:biotin/lipoyl-binding carrier protein n=1 Tax=Mumia TaxID=1546255 RepID=UPI0014244B17|nr:MULTISPECIES: biotin/lipoyl-binding carrier protein [unclassified Mumia]QMW65870.1 biotin/lipoyl-binding carrier protein [Mumia sp. ZJ1417]
MYAAKAEIVGNVWRVVAREGDRVAAGDLVAVLETMKMEIPVHAGAAGTVRLKVAEGQIVQEGDVIAEIG